MKAVKTEANWDQPSVVKMAVCRVVQSVAKTAASLA